MKFLVTYSILFLTCTQIHSVDFCSLKFDKKYNKMLGIGQFGQDQSIELKNYKQSKSILVLGDSDFFDFSIGKKLAKAFPSKKIISGDIEHNIRTYIDYSPAEPNRYKLNYIVLRPRLGLFQKIKSQFKKIVN